MSRNSDSSFTLTRGINTFCWCLCQLGCYCACAIWLHSRAIRNPPCTGICQVVLGKLLNRIVMPQKTFSFPVQRTITCKTVRSEIFPYLSFLKKTYNYKLIHTFKTCWFKPCLRELINQISHRIQEMANFCFQRASFNVNKHQFKQLPWRKKF